GIGDENRIKRIDLIDVEYKYPNSSVNALEKINFSMHTGELIAIIGENGSGKSTLVKLISGLYTPSKGHIYYNGIEDKHISTDFYQKNISILFQDFVKYELTLRENIGLGNIAEKWD
ncbi:ATP-binding cassette domain-containing protein, partial [Lactobacillus salivarius]|nr:ATP-binding cassette domain-containing protein [Ligilactobacillus salivarius]